MYEVRSQHKTASTNNKNTHTQHKIRKASSLLLLRFMFCALALDLVWDVVVGVAVLCLDLQILNNGVLIIAYWSSIHGIL